MSKRVWVHFLNLDPGQLSDEELIEGVASLDDSLYQLCTPLDQISPVLAKYKEEAKRRPGVWEKAEQDLKTASTIRDALVEVSFGWHR